MQFETQAYNLKDLFTKRVQENQSKMNYMYVHYNVPLANRAILNILVFSRKDLFRLWVFALTGEQFYYWHCRVLPNVLQTFKNLIYTFTLAYKSSYVCCRLAHLTGAFKIILIQYCLLLDLIRSISNYMWQILFICKGQQTFESINQSAVYSQDHPKRISADMELRNYPKP